MRENRTSGSEGGGTELNRSFLPLFASPTPTSSRGLTTGSAGAPACWCNGMVTAGGGGSVSIGRSAVRCLRVGGMNPTGKRWQADRSEQCVDDAHRVTFSGKNALMR